MFAEAGRLIAGARQARLRGRVLALCTSEHDWGIPPPGLGRLVAGADLSSLPDAAITHGVAACAYYSLKSLDGVEEQVLERLDLARRRSLEAHLRVLADLRTVARLLAGTGVSWAVLKGPVLAEAVYRHHDLRSYSDLDLLVPRADFATVVRAFEASGCPLVDRNWMIAKEQMAGEVNIVLPHGTLLDLHWELLYDGDLRGSFSIPTEAMLERCRPVRVGDHQVRSLDPSDLLIHLAVHSFREGGGKLRWLKDIEQAVLYDTPDWDEVIRRARTWRVDLVVATMLLRARDTLGFAVPPEVMRSLSGWAWRSVVSAADTLWPVERTSQPASPATMVARATRADLRSSLGALAVSASRRLTARSDREERGPDVSLEWLRPTGDPAHLCEYLSAVSGDPRAEPAG
ncbi:MAG TPA: nucleotidyltransferase family protein [Acidimicrobiales bacterium]|nr:nucleotidyltransferase family protein [Acidimicrobiales bacterium]